MKIQSLVKIGNFLVEKGFGDALNDSSVSTVLDGIAKLLSYKDLQLTSITTEMVQDLSAGHMDQVTCESVAQALRAFADGSELKLSELISNGQWVNLISGRTVREADQSNEIVVRRCPSCGELLFN